MEIEQFFNDILSLSQRLHVFPRLPTATYFPALSIGYKFSYGYVLTLFFRAYQRLHVFPRFSLVLRIVLRCYLKLHNKLGLSFASVLTKTLDLKEIKSSIVQSV